MPILHHGHSKEPDHLRNPIPKRSAQVHSIGSREPTTMEKHDTEARGRTGSIASIQNAEVLANATGPKPGESWLERKLKPTKINARYPIKGKALLFATCGFGSLGDALFGYNSGKLCFVRTGLRFDQY